MPAVPGRAAATFAANQDPARPGRRRWLAALGGAAWPGARAGASTVRVPVLVYHRFGPTVADAMTVRHTTFQGQLRVLRELQCQPLPLAELVAWRLGERESLPPRALALCADDGHRSQYEFMAPALDAYGWPATLFVYPSAISNARYAMSWEQLAALQAGGRFSIQSHTYWHPNLLRERTRMAPERFERHAGEQLRRSRERLAQRLGTAVSLLAWPFGLTDAGLMTLAARMGYRASFVLGNRALGREDPVQALPRYLVSDALSPARLATLIGSLFAPARWGN